MEKIKYGIIGAGTMAREHILNLSLIDEAEVVALSDPHEESLKQCQELLKKEVVCFKNHQDLIKENLVDVYIICLLYTSPSPRDATLSRMPSSA